VSPEVIIFAIIIVVLLGAMAALWLMLQKANKKLVTQANTPIAPTVTAPTAAELEAQLKTAYQVEITKSTTIFAADLTATSAKLSEQVSRLTTQVIEEELGAYQSTLESRLSASNYAKVWKPKSLPSANI
jgi:flagellar basal body-associated protein FliL